MSDNNTVDFFLKNVYSQDGSACCFFLSFTILIINVYVHILEVQV